MSISSRITEMEQHIGNAYDKIEDLGIDLTDVDKNINNISAMLENVWDEYPKVTATDVEEASINGTKKGRINIDLKGQTEQDTLTGKNLLDGANPTSTNLATATMTDNTIKVSSTATNTTPYVRYEINNVTEGELYRLNAIIKNSIGRIVLQGYTSSWSTLTSKDYVDGTSITSLNYTIPEGTTAIRYLLYSNKAIPTEASESNYENVIVTKNNSDMSYEPYCGGIPSPNPDYPQPIKNVTGQANVKIQNKNLFDITKVNHLALGSGVVLYNVSYRGYTLPVNPGEIYTISRKTTSTPNRFRVCFTIEEPRNNLVYYGENGLSDVGNYINCDTDTVCRNITVPNDMNYLFIYLSNSNETITEAMEIQLEQGSTATSYVAHQEQNLPFTLGTQRMYQGSYLADDGIHNAWGEIVLDGTENWSVFVREGFYTYYINIAKGKGYTALCNYFKNETTIIITQIPSVNCFKFNGETNKNVIFNRGDTENKLKNWKNYLAEQYANGTPVKVQYKLQQEEIIPYNSTQQAQYNAIKKAQGYDDQTNISQTNDELPFILDIEALKGGN